MRYVSWIFSLFLHLTLVLGGLLLSNLEMHAIRLDEPVYQVDIVELAPRGPGLKPDAAPGYEAPPEANAPKTPDGTAIPEDKTEPKPDAAAEEAVKKAAEEAARQAAVEMQRQADAEAARQKLAAEQAAQKAAQEKAAKDAADKLAKEKAAKDAADKAAKDAAEKAAKDAAQKEAAAKNSVNDALKDIKAKSTGASGASAVNAALADINKQQGGGGGSRGGGTASDAVYTGIVEKLIKQNWRFPRSDELKLSATIEFQVKRDGSIQSARVIQTSGREDFDNSAMRAIQETQTLPVPPSEKLVRLTFNSQEKHP